MPNRRRSSISFGKLAALAYDVAGEFSVDTDTRHALAAFALDVLLVESQARLGNARLHAAT